MAKPVIIGLYGVSGSGKTHLMNALQAPSSPLYTSINSFMFFDGSDELSQVCGGMDNFKTLHDDAKSHFRQKAIASIQYKCARSSKIGIVAGHYLLWDDAGKDGEKVWTLADEQVYTHIVYLRVDLALVKSRRNADMRERSEVSVEHLKKWQEREIGELRNVCREAKIFFTVVTETLGGPPPLGRISDMVRDFRTHCETDNRMSVERAIARSIEMGDGKLETVIVFDADKTLAPQDTGEVFWKLENAAESTIGMVNPLKVLFKSWHYSYDSFRQTILLYEEKADEFEKLCDQVASEIDLYPDIKSFLHRATDQEHVQVVVLTCGIRRVWEKVLQHSGLGKIPIIGGGRLSDKYVVTGDIKGYVVGQLQAKGLRVVAFGDSPLDLDMLAKADHGYVVVGERSNRSKSMEMELELAIKKGLYANQIVFSGDKDAQVGVIRGADANGANHRLHKDILPVVELKGEVADWILGRHVSITDLTNKKYSKILSSRSRNANISGPELQNVHEEAGKYLANEYVTELLGLEEFEVPHVEEGKVVHGHRLRAENRTVIISLMRGGDPLARGVFKAFPTATYLHTKKATDIERKDLFRARAVILVDWVVNTGKSIVEYVEHIRTISPYMDIVVVAGVVQRNVTREGKFFDLLKSDRKLRLVALRTSENKYTGRGGTDTGHRLNNTAYRDEIDL